MGLRTWAFPMSWHSALWKSDREPDGLVWVPALPLRSCLVFSKSSHFSRFPFLHLWRGRSTICLEWLLQGTAQKKPNAVLQKEQRHPPATPRRAWRAVFTLVSFPSLIADDRLLVSTLDCRKAPSPALTEQALDSRWEKRAADWGHAEETPRRSVRGPGPPGGLCPCARRGFGPVTSPLLATLAPSVK